MHVIDCCAEMMDKITQDVVGFIPKPGSQCHAFFLSTSKNVRARKGPSFGMTSRRIWPSIPLSSERSSSSSPRWPCSVQAMKASPFRRHACGKLRLRKFGQARSSSASSPSRRRYAPPRCSVRSAGKGPLFANALTVCSVRPRPHRPSLTFSNLREVQHACTLKCTSKQYLFSFASYKPKKTHVAYNHPLSIPSYLGPAMEQRASARSAGSSSVQSSMTRSPTTPSINRLTTWGDIARLA